MRPLKKSPLTDLKKNYILHFETGLILSLLSVIGLFKLDISQSSKNGAIWSIADREILTFENSPQTVQAIPQPKMPQPVFVPPTRPKYKLIRARLQDLDMELTIPDPLPITTHKEHNNGNYKSLEAETSKPYTYVDEMPRLIGGKEGLRKTITYPSRAIKDNIQGRVILQFVVDENGRVHDPEILKGVREDIDKEAVKAITKARFTPGRQQGKPVRVEYVMFIRFKLENS